MFGSPSMFDTPRANIFNDPCNPTRLAPMLPFFQPLGKGVTLCPRQLLNAFQESSPISSPSVVFAFLTALVSTRWPIVPMFPRRYQALSAPSVSCFPRIPLPNIVPLPDCLLHVYGPGSDPTGRGVHTGAPMSQLVLRVGCFKGSMADAPGAARKLRSSAIANPMTVNMDLCGAEQAYSPACEGTSFRKGVTLGGTIGDN